jgi:hypothetical protein
VCQPILSRCWGAGVSLLSSESWLIYVGVGVWRAASGAEGAHNTAPRSRRRSPHHIRVR